MRRTATDGEARHLATHRRKDHARRRSAIDFAKRLVHAALPTALERRLRFEGRRLVLLPRVGGVDLGHLRRLTPISRANGYERGTPIDRYYIEGFLARHAADIRGRVLDIYEDRNARRFGGDRVQSTEVLHLTEGNPRATIVADLTDAPAIPSGSFDCVLLTQTLQLVYEPRDALRTVRRILRPGGVVLATLPTVSQICRDPGDAWDDCWRFTSSSARRLFEEVFAADDIEVEAHGNVLAAVAFLEGLAAEELSAEELDHADPLFEVLVTVRAVHPGGDAPTPP